MDDFLRILQLSESAIKIYQKFLGKKPLTYYELYSTFPKVSPDEFKDVINELLNAGLILQQEYKNEEMLIHYYLIPPILPILNYYNNIDANLPDIKNSIQELLIKSINEIFEKNKVIELDTILKAFQEIIRDIQEDSIIQKLEVEDIVEGMEVLKKIKEEISTLQQEIKSITQSKFSDLIKTINSLKIDLIEQINSLEFKKHKQEIIDLVEKSFKEKFDSMIGDFTDNLFDLIDKKITDTSKPFETITGQVFQYRDDFKMLLLNMLSNFETKMNKIHELIHENNENLSGYMKNLEIRIVEKLNSIILNSLNEVSGLNKPIVDVLNAYFNAIPSFENALINKIWVIRSVTKINEEIQKIITSSKKDLIIVIPNLESHLFPDQFKEINANLRIQIASSEAHTNSIVKNLKNNPNLKYKTFQNEDFILVRGDEDRIIFGIKQDSKDVLSDFIGIGSNLKPFITILAPIVKALWEQAYSDTFYAGQKTKTQVRASTPKPSTHFTPKTMTQKFTPKIETKTKVTGFVSETENKKTPIATPAPLKKKVKEKIIGKAPVPQEMPPPPPPKEQIKDLKLKLQEKINFLSAIHPKTGDKAGILIENALNDLIQKLDTLKGDEFSKELQIIADLILENKGFSVTLHKVRSTITKFKEKLTLLNEEDKKGIFETIEDWKKKLF